MQRAKSLKSLENHEGESALPNVFLVGHGWASGRSYGYPIERWHNSYCVAIGVFSESVPCGKLEE
jgi:hypothetical protein